MQKLFFQLIINKIMETLFKATSEFYQNNSTVAVSYHINWVRKAKQGTMLEE